MPKYRYKAKTLDNKIVKGVFTASGEDDLREIIADQDYYLISARKLNESIELFSFLESIKVQDLAMFCDQFSVMISAGMEIVKALEVLKSTTSNKKLKKILENVHVEVQRGKMLSEAFAKYDRVFPRFFRNMVAIGEKSGKLDDIFTSLSEYYRKEASTKRKVKSALAYPIFLVCLAIGVFAILTLFIVPMFRDIFNDLGVELPMITVIVLDVSNFMRENYLLIFGVIVLFAALIMVLKRNKEVAKTIDSLKLQLTALKNLTVATATARFTRGLGVLLASGVPILESMETMSKLMDNEVVKERLQVSTNEIKRGKSIAKSLSTINTFPEMLIEMTEIGEQTASLEYVLKRVTEYYDEDLEAQIKKVVGMIEPILIMVVALLVVIVMLAVFLPIMELQNSIEVVAGV